MAAINFTAKEYGRRFRKAVSVPFGFEQACSSSVQQFINIYADSIGCSNKCVFFPLLSCCAACMGPDAQIELNANWQEPPIIWTLVITPRTLHRFNVANHLREQVLAVQADLNAVKTENNDSLCNKFVVGVTTLEILQDFLRSNDGQALGVYSSTQELLATVNTTINMEVMRSLHAGSSWFSSSRLTKKLLTKTQMNIAIVSDLNMVYKTLSIAPDFQDLYDDCFLTICAEESHLKYSKNAVPPESENLQQIFREIIKLHTSHKITYKLSEEAAAKFGTIHDEISDKAKQMARKNAGRVFPPALSYLARLSLVLHVLENAIEAVNISLPLDHLTWNCEISADSVGHARQVLGYVIEQKYYLNQPTVVEPPPSKPVESVTVVDNNNPAVQRGRVVRSNLFSSPQRSSVNNSPRAGNFQITSPRTFINRSPRFKHLQPTATQQPSPMQQTTNNAFDMLLMSNNANVNGSTSGISGVEVSEIRSAGVAVPTDTAFMPVITSVTSLENSASAGNEQVAADITSESLSSMPEDEFCRAYKVQLRRFFLHELKDISLNLCIQLKLAPKPSGGFQSNEHKSAISRSFLKRLESLGFGALEGSNGPKTRYMVFKKLPFTSLGEHQQQILSNLRVGEREYGRCFRLHKTVTNTKNTQSSGSVVCLE